MITWSRRSPSRSGLTRPMRLVARIATRTTTTWSLYGPKKARIRRRVRARRSLGTGVKSADAPPNGRPPRGPCRRGRHRSLAPPVAVRVCPRGKPIRPAPDPSSSRTRRYHGMRTRASRQFSPGSICGDHSRCLRSARSPPARVCCRSAGITWRHDPVPCLGRDSRCFDPHAGSPTSGFEILAAPAMSSPTVGISLARPSR